MKIFKFILLSLFFFTLFLTVDRVFLINQSVAPDFQVFWLGAKDLVNNVNPYVNTTSFTGIGYPQYSLLLFTPLASLDYYQAQLIFSLLSVVSALTSIWICIKIVKFDSETEIFLVVTTLLFISFPAIFTLGMGQNNFIAFIFILLSFYLYLKNKNLLSGVLLGIGVSIKPVFSFLILFYLLKKKWKLVVVSIAGLTILFLISGMFFGFDNYKYYIEVVIPSFLKIERSVVYYNQSFVAFISRLITDNKLREIFHYLIFLITTILLSLLTIKSKNQKLIFSLFIISLLLIDRNSWQHHFVWLLLPYVLISRELLLRNKNHLFILLFASYVFVSWNFRDTNEFSGFVGNLLYSHVFIGGVLLWVLNFKLLELNRWDT